MKINDRIQKPPTSEWDEKLSRAHYEERYGQQTPSRRERLFGEMQERGMEARRQGKPRPRFYQGMLRELDESELDRLNDFIDTERKNISTQLGHPERVVRQRAAGAVSDLERFRRQVASTLHPSEGGIRDLLKWRRAMVDDMARARGISPRDAAIEWLRSHGAANKLAMERMGMESQTLGNKLSNAARGFMRYDLPRKAMSARKLMKGLYDIAMSGPDPLDAIGPIMGEATRGSYPTPYGVRRSRVPEEL